jgi:predicted metalloprotease
MQFGDERESQNVEDRRGQGFRPGGGIRIGGGIGTIAIVLIALYFGVDPRVLLNLGSDNGPQTQQSAPPQTRQGAQNTGEDAQRRFVAQVLASTEDVWTDVFRQHGRQYQDPHLVLFSGAVQSACGTAQTAVGPFYCPRDDRVYLDTGFFAEMQNRLGAGGDFARAYVIAHEVGHHVQTMLGITDKVDQIRARAGDQGEGANGLSVRVELQADCFAGVWANRADAAKHILEHGDIEQGLNAASAIGDDKLQQRSRGYVEPDSFTHGSSAQRVRWFKRGLDGGQIEQCDTFSPDRL